MFSRDASLADIIRKKVQPLAETLESPDGKPRWNQDQCLAEENRANNQSTINMFYRDQSDSSILSASSYLSDLSSIELFRRPVNLFSEKKIDGFFDEKENLEKTFLKRPTSSEIINNQTESVKKPDYQKEATKKSINLDYFSKNLQELIPNNVRKKQNEKEKMKVYQGFKNKVLSPLKSQMATKKAQDLLLVRNSTKIVKYSDESDNHSEISIVLPSITQIPLLQNGNDKEKSMLSIDYKYNAETIVEEFTKNIYEQIEFKSDGKVVSLPPEKEMFSKLKIMSPFKEELIVAIPNSVKIQKEKKSNKKLYFFIMVLSLIILVFVTIGIVILLVELKKDSNSELYSLAKNIAVVSLLTQGYTLVYSNPFSHLTTSNELSAISSSCNENTMICVGAGLNNSNTLMLLSCGECRIVLNFTQINRPVLINSAYWYFTDGYSFGYSPTSTIQQTKCDTYDLQNDQRLCFQLNSMRKRDLNDVTGGSRIGSNLNLDNDSSYMKMIYLKSSNAVQNTQTASQNRTISSTSLIGTSSNTISIKSSLNPSTFSSSTKNTTVNILSQIISQSSINSANQTASSNSIPTLATSTVLKNSSLTSIVNTQITSSLNYHTNTLSSLTVSPTNIALLNTTLTATGSSLTNSTGTITTVISNKTSNSLFSNQTITFNIITAIISTQLVNSITNVSSTSFSTMRPDSSNSSNNSETYLFTNSFLITNATTSHQTLFGSLSFFNSTSILAMVANSTVNSLINNTIYFNISINNSINSVNNSGNLTYDATNVISTQTTSQNQLLNSSIIMLSTTSSDNLLSSSRTQLNTLSNQQMPTTIQPLNSLFNSTSVILNTSLINLIASSTLTTFLNSSAGHLTGATLTILNNSASTNFPNNSSFSIITTPSLNSNTTNTINQINFTLSNSQSLTTNSTSCSSPGLANSNFTSDFPMNITNSTLVKNIIIDLTTVTMFNTTLLNYVDQNQNLSAASFSTNSSNNSLASSQFLCYSFNTYLGQTQAILNCSNTNNCFYSYLNSNSHGIWLYSSCGTEFLYPFLDFNISNESNALSSSCFTPLCNSHQNIQSYINSAPDMIKILVNYTNSINKSISNENSTASNFQCSSYDLFTNTETNLNCSNTNYCTSKIMTDSMTSGCGNGNITISSTQYYFYNVNSTAEIYCQSSLCNSVLNTESLLNSTILNWQKLFPL